MKRQIEQLLQFHETFNCHIEATPTADLPEGVAAARAGLIQEELGEYREALGAGDLVRIADSLADLPYVVLGAYTNHGLHSVAEALFDEIHRSNMSKLDGDGKPIHRADGKVLKSDRWSPPDLRPIIESATGTSGVRRQTVS